MTDRTEKLEELLAITILMRNAQKRYFRDRSPENLKASKLLERQVDQAADALTPKAAQAPQPKQTDIFEQRNA